VSESILELQSIICHLRSHSVTCHQTLVNVSHLKRQPGRLVDMIEIR